MPAIIESEQERNDAVTLEDARTAAKHWVKRARYATENALDDVAHRLRRYPVRSVGVAFGAGAFLGVLLGCLRKKGG